MVQHPEIRLDLEELEARIAPSMPPGLLGYEGQPGNQGRHGGHGNPSGSANPEVPAGRNPQPN
jgi:hypothetical protein